MKKKLIFLVMTFLLTACNDGTYKSVEIDNDILISLFEPYMRDIKINMQATTTCRIGIGFAICNFVTIPDGKVDKQKIYSEFFSQL